MRSLTNCPNQIRLREINLIYYPSSQSRIIKNIKKSKNTSSTLVTRLKFIPDFYTYMSHQLAWWEDELQSFRHKSLQCLPPHILSPASMWDPSYRRQSSMIFFTVKATFLHILLQHGNFLWSAILQEQTAPAWVCSTMSQVLSVACSRMGFPQGHSLLQQWSIHIEHERSFYQVLTEGTPVVLPLPNPMHLISCHVMGIDPTCAFRMMS